MFSCNTAQTAKVRKVRRLSDFMEETGNFIGGDNASRVVATCEGEKWTEVEKQVQKLRKILIS